jgi:signal transduction histidine kinase
MFLLAVEAELYIPGLLVLGASFILSLYHFFLYMQYRERLILLYTAYLFFIAAYIACYLMATYYYPVRGYQFIYYVKESMNVAAIISYCLFLSEAVHNWHRFPLLFRVFNAVSGLVIVYCFFFIVAGLTGLRQDFIFSVLPLVIRIMLLLLALIALPLLFPRLQEKFLKVIKWGAVIYLVIILMVMAAYLTPDEKLLGMDQMQIFFIGTFIDIIVFSFAMGYKVRSVFTKILDMRTRISQDLHDDIGATLSGIKVFSQLAKDRPEASAEYLEKINTYSDDMLSKMGDIVWSINTENDSFESIISKLHSYAKNLTAARNIQLRFAADADLQKRSPDMGFRRNLYLITKEAVNNAVKYSSCSYIKVELQPYQKGLKLLVEDDGNGFDTEAYKEGNGLKNMRRRAAEINGTFTIQSKPGKGTSIGVVFNFT